MSVSLNNYWMKILLSIALTVCSSLWFNLSFSQNWNKIAMSEQDAMFLLSQRKFDKAADLYIKILKEAPKSANLKSKVGYCLLRTDSRQLESIPYLEEAAEMVSDKYSETSIKETNSPPETYFLLGEAYRAANRLKEAVEAYGKFKAMYDSSDELARLAENRIAGCKSAEQLSKEPTSLVRHTGIGPKVNNEYSNINPVFSGDGKTLAYTTQTRTGFDIYVVPFVNDTLGAPVKITKQLGSDFLKTASLSYDGKQLFLISMESESADIYYSELKGAKWSSAKEMPSPINGKGNETHAFISKDGLTLYFTSDRKGGSGGLDIYKASMEAKGKWGKPVNLGPEINTEFNEDCPFLSPDESNLFFSSEGHNGMGGYDIFRTSVASGSTPVNLGYPVNDATDNRFFYPFDNGKVGYISQFKNDGLGQNDIYRIQISKFVTLDGVVTPDKTNGNYNVAIFDVAEGDTIARPVVDMSTGQFTYKAIEGKYIVFVNGEKYLPTQENVSIPDNNNINRISIRLALASKPEPKPVEVKAEPAKLVAEAKVVTPVVAVIPPAAEIISEAKPAELPKVEEAKPVAVKKEVVKTPKPMKPKPEKKPKPEQKPAVHKEIKLEPKFVAQSDSSASGSVTTYSVQLMALKTEAPTGTFKNVEGVELTTSADGYYRYSVGNTTEVNYANVLLGKMRALGFADAFIRKNSIPGRFTIQLMAVKKQVEVSYFSNLSDVVVIKGADGFYRYTLGSFNSSFAAAGEIKRLNKLGYKQAFVRLMPQSE